MAIATGIIDVQLMGLPEVKRQLDGIPRLLDGVAKSAISMQREINAVFTEASKKRSDFMKSLQGMSPADFQKAWQDRPQTGQQAVASGFRKSMQERIDVGYEAETGKLTQQQLDTELQQLDAIEKQAQAYGPVEAALHRVIQAERQRIELSKQAVADETGRFKGILGDEFQDFKKAITRDDDVKALEKKRKGLEEFRRSVDMTKKVNQAFVQQTEAEIAKDEEFLKKKQDLAAQIHEVSNKRAKAINDQKKGIITQKQATIAVKRYNKELMHLNSQMGNVEREQSQFNQTLHGTARGSRIANYQMQQLSFAAQDAIQVYGQTGLAGALHASANNVSMFVQTLQGIPPAYQALAAFGVTAGMMALSAWFKKTKDEAEKANDELKRRIRLMDMLRERHEAAANLTTGEIGDELTGAIRDLEVAIEKRDLGISDIEEKLNDQAQEEGRGGTLARAQIASLHGADQATMDAFREKFATQFANDMAMDGDNSGEDNVAAGRRVFDKMMDTAQIVDKAYADMSASEKKERTEMLKEQQRAVREASGNLKELTDAAEALKVEFDDSPFRELMRSIRNAAGMDEKVSMGARRNAAGDALSRFSFSGPQGSETSRDALRRIRAQRAELVQAMQQGMLLTPESVAHIRKTFADAEKEIQKLRRQEIEKAAQKRAKVEGILDSFRKYSPLEKQLRAIDKALADLMQTTSDPNLIARGQGLADAARRRVTREHRRKEAGESRKSIEGVMKSLSGGLSDEGKKRMDQIFAHADRKRQIDGLDIPGPMKSRLRALSFSQLQEGLKAAGERNIGMSDPKSLHKQIQKSLKTNKQTELQKKTNDLLQQMYDLWERESAKERPLII